MDFLNENILWNLLWIIPLVIFLFLLVRRKRITNLKKLLGKRYRESEYNNVSYSKRFIKNWLILLSLIFLFIAASRPYWGYKLLPFTGKGRDILVVLDVSKSMMSQDIKPSRLSHAKLLLKNLIKATPEDRYGLIAFAGSAFLECPLTIDRTSLFNILNEINTESIPIGGTNLERALSSAITAFQAAEGGYKAVILVTDGDELQGDSSKIIDKLKDLKIPLLIVGIGNPEKPGLIQIKTKDNKSTFLRDSNGNLVKSRLNEIGLKKLADSTNGIYIRSTAKDPGLKILEKNVDNLIPEEYKTGKVTRALERFQIPLFLSILCLLIWFVMGEKKYEN